VRVENERAQTWEQSFAITGMKRAPHVLPSLDIWSILLAAACILLLILFMASAQLDGIGLGYVRCSPKEGDSWGKVSCTTAF
jgi:hypothetical protein